MGLEKIRAEFEIYECAADDGPQTDPMWLHYTADTDSYGLIAINGRWTTWKAAQATKWYPASICPKFKEVMLYRADCGVVMGRYCDRDTLMTDKEHEEWDGEEETLYELEFWCYGERGFELMDGLETPTHWAPLPEGPEIAE